MNDFIYSSQNTTNVILQTYGKNDLSSIPPFQGGYINFGYWHDIERSNNREISVAERIKASFDLYKLLLDKLNIKHEDSVLEAGSGLGYGCKYVAENYNPAKLTCIDLTPEQIERSKSLHKGFDNINFKVAAADNTDELSNSYEVIYSVEAAQHFPSIESFALEAFRLLKSGGKLAITAHFATSEQGYNNAKELLPIVANGVDTLTPINQLMAEIENSGFKTIEFKSIGSEVFPAFDQWLSQVGNEPWAENILKLYLSGDMDYYTLVFEKI